MKILESFTEIPTVGIIITAAPCSSEANTSGVNTIGIVVPNYLCQTTQYSSSLLYLGR